MAKKNYFLNLQKRYGKRDDHRCAPVLRYAAALRYDLLRKSLSERRNEKMVFYRIAFAKSDTLMIHRLLSRA